MLKRILIFACLFLAILKLDAQDLFKSSTYIGINAGINICRVSFTPSVEQNLLTDMQAGLVFRHISEPHIGLQIEVNYAGKGWTENRDSIGLYTRNLKVINLPVMAVFIIGSKTFRFSFLLGPYGSYLRSESETIDIPGYQTITNPLTTQYLPYYGKPLENKLEFGFVGGLGFELYTKIGVFGIRATYSHSLTNLFPLNASEFYYNASRSQALQAGLTYFIQL